ncbi:MAG: HAMP domain-containing sensor histidine kinase [Acidobacteriota bacterium]
MPRPRSLRFQLTLTIAGVVAASMLFVTVGTYLFVAWGEYRFLMSLSPEAREEYARNWSETGFPDDAIVREVAIAEEQILGPVYEGELQVVAILSVIAMLVGGAFSIVLARRLTAPLEMATRSARTIAEGTFDHRMSIPSGASREVDSLAASFEHLAASLERMEENLQVTSASIAHEIRTPLTVVQGYLQGIRDGVFEASDEQLDLMLRRMDALGRLIDDLKTLSLAHAGRLQLDVAPTRLRGRLSDLVEWVRRDRDTSRIVFEGDAEDAPVRVDGERIEQVVLGLVQNALTYGGDGVRVTVRLTHEAEVVAITVDDDGPGFSAEALDHAGERFWRGESSRSRESGGSGLGLAIAKAIAEAHGGHLELSNRSGGGGAVRLQLPRLGPRGPVTRPKRPSDPQEEEV